jgi:ribosomal protein S18 acetylase RimI-like enzyme
LAVPRNSREPIGCVVGKIDQEEIMTSAAGGGAGSPLMNNSGSDEDVHGSNGNSHSNTNHSTETMAKVPTGYIGMLAVQSKYRRKGIGKALVRQVLQRMKDMGCTSVTLETEVKNGTAQRLYQDCFGFVREELLVRYYLNWGDAYRLRLWF